MPVRLNDEQWARILSMSGKLSTGTTSGDAGSGGHPSVHKSNNEFVYLLALEGDKPDASWTWREWLLDTVVQMAQPAPSLTHIELIVPARNDKDDVHFSTYLGKGAHWGSSFANSEDYYLNPDRNGQSWRAVPIVAHDAISRLRNECKRHVDTPYGDVHRLYNYPFAVPPLRSLAWALDDEPMANAHCATLVARCLKLAFPELYIGKASAWYGPSTLFLELTRNARMVSYLKRIDKTKIDTSLSNKDANDAAEKLLRGSDEDVRNMTDDMCQAGIDSLSFKTVSATAGNDVAAELSAQKDLARALLRASLIARNTRLQAHNASTSMAEQALFAPTLDGPLPLQADGVGNATTVPTFDGRGEKD